MVGSDTGSMNLPVVPTSVVESTVRSGFRIETFVPLIGFVPMVTLVMLRLTFWRAVPEKVSLAFWPGEPAANVSGSGVPAVIAPDWSAETS